MQNDVKELVKQRYGDAARRVSQTEPGGCCGGTVGGTDPITANLYDPMQAGQVPGTVWLLLALGALAIALAVSIGF